MTQSDENKKKAALAALKYVDDDIKIIGVGTGSTTNYFIEALATCKDRLEGAVASSKATTERLQEHNIPILSLNSVGTVPLYVDGADEVNSSLQLIKGGGGALTREKIIAAASRRFVCIADSSKQVDILGKFPLPLEVIPMARSYVAREVVKLGGQPVLRENYITENGNRILDVHNLQIMEPIELEATLNQIPGIVCVGLFAKRPADIVLLADASGIKTLTAY